MGTGGLRKKIQSKENLADRQGNWDMPEGGEGAGIELDSNWDEITETFDDMELREDLLRGIYAYGFEKPSAIQQKAVKPMMLGRDVIAQAQSGTGKTTCAPSAPSSNSTTPRSRRCPWTSLISFEKATCILSFSSGKVPGIQVMSQLGSVALVGRQKTDKTTKSPKKKKKKKNPPKKKKKKKKKS